MSHGLATRGYISPLTGTGGGGGGGGASGIAIPFQLKNSATGDFDNGIDLSASGVVQVSKNGASFADRAGAAPTNITGGDGAYYYNLDTTEVTTNWVWLKVRKTGYEKIDIVWPIDDDPTNDDLDAQTTTLSNAITAARDSVNGNVDAVPTAAEIDAQLSGTHGAGSWAGSDTAAIDAALTASHGAGSWAGLTSNQTRDAVWSAIGEGAFTYGDLMRGTIGALVGRSSGYKTGTIVIKSLNGAKTRWTITADKTGRLTLTPGDLT